jgi:hypothetical protein
MGAPYPRIFLLSPGGSHELHAAFLNESRTRGHGQSRAQEIRVSRSTCAECLMTFHRIDDAGTSSGPASAGLPPRKCWSAGRPGQAVPSVSSWPNGCAEPAEQQALAMHRGGCPGATAFPSLPCGAANSILASKAPNTENPAHGIGPCRPRKKISKTLRGNMLILCWGGVMLNFEHLRETKDLERFTICVSSALHKL